MGAATGAMQYSPSPRTSDITSYGKPDPAKRAEYEAMARAYDASPHAENYDMALNEMAPSKHYAKGGLTTKVELYNDYGMDFNKTGNPYVNYKTWTYADAFTTRTSIFGGPRIHVSPGVVGSGDPVYFQAVFGHEYIHAYHYSTGNFSQQASESVAYRYTYNTYFKAGRYEAAFSTMNTARSWGFWGVPVPEHYNSFPFFLP